MIQEAFLEGLFTKVGADAGRPRGGTGAGKSGELLAGLGQGGRGVGMTPGALGRAVLGRQSQVTQSLQGEGQ